MDVNKIPDQVTKEIDRAFKKISQDTKSAWGYYNGKLEYRLGCVEDDRLALHILQNGGDQTQFHFLDIGGGDHSWIWGIASVINSQENVFPTDLEVHLYSLRGEGGDSTWGKKIGRCTLYEYNSCKIEDLPQAFKDRKITAKFDYIVSHFTLRHLVAPLLVFKNAYDLTRPGGFLLMDGFRINVNNGKHDENDHCNEQQVHILQDTGDAFLIRPYSVLESINQFVLQKTQDQPYQAPMIFTGIQETKDPQVASGKVSCFLRPQEKNLSSEDKDKINPFKKCGQTLVGSEALYNFLIQNNLFYNDEITKIPQYLGDFSTPTEKFYSKL